MKDEELGGKKMIIVSQDKKAIHNFNNILSIQIEKSNSTFKLIIYDAINDNTSIGEYATEERAKEILEEIVEKYENCCRLQETHGISITLKNNYVYEMPKE